MRFLVSTMLLLVSVLVSVLVQGAETAEEELHRIKLEDLGRALFFDVNLSRDRTQSCGTCHDPAVAFVDWRENAVGRAASVGDDGISLGDRNAPTASYARFSPSFHRDAEGEYRGGQFWDGRADNLVAQAGGPPLNPLEMAMPDQASVSRRLQESPVYVQAFRNLFGSNIFERPEKVYQAMAESIAAFEESGFFSPFDAKYDRYLRGEYQPTEQEELGMTLFFSQQFSNCNRCHQLNSRADTEGETFSNYKYKNIGVPVNKVLRAANGLGEQHIDHGLLDNPAVDDPLQAGRFKVPTLRNVAVTGPYMHNGVFADLRTVMLFYNKFNARSAASRINPETGEPWGEPEVAENIALEELEQGPALDAQRIDALVAFLKMLTDRRYEQLVDSADLKHLLR
ncbi:MAG: cytochrome c peroxidase [Pseudomonadales bacterium]|nr:cytochrome c peroxidase [Pseudomonadales bacterium]